MDGRRSVGRARIAACAALLVVAMAGTAAVLDVGFATAEAAPDVSPFAGNWSGTWAIAALEKGGTFDWTISDAGQITGTVVTTFGTSGSSGGIVGHVGADGHIGMIGYAPNDEPSTGHNGSPFQGTAEIDDEGRLVVSMTAMFNAFPNNQVEGWLVASLVKN
jgi:hypothetical protein